MDRENNELVIDYSYVAATAEIEEAESGNKNSSFSYIQNLEDQIVYYVQVKIKSTFPFDTREFPWIQPILPRHHLLRWPCLLCHYRHKNKTLPFSLALSFSVSVSGYVLLCSVVQIKWLTCSVSDKKNKKRQDFAGLGWIEEGVLGS